MGKSRARNRAVLPKREGRERERESRESRGEAFGIEEREREPKERMHSKKKRK